MENNNSHSLNHRMVKAIVAPYFTPFDFSETNTYLTYFPFANHPRVTFPSFFSVPRIWGSQVFPNVKGAFSITLLPEMTLL